METVLIAAPYVTRDRVFSIQIELTLQMAARFHLLQCCSFKRVMGMLLLHINIQKQEINMVFAYFRIQPKNVTQNLLTCKKVILHFLKT